MILDEIIAYKRQELVARRRAVPPAELQARGAGRRPPLDFAAALIGEGVRLIAEVKRASPSRGVLCPDLDPVRLATTYATYGAAAISVLTDARFFQGGLEHLAQIRQALPAVPLLCKDFIVHPYQVHEAYAYGADAVLLIVAVLSGGLLGELLALVRELGMAALVEVHDEGEVEQQVLRWQPRVVGINNRNLHDFSVDLSTFGRLRPLLPAQTIVVGESGVRTAADVRRLAAMGANAVLVGEALVTAGDVAAKVQELAMAGARHASPLPGQAPAGSGGTP